MKRISEVMALCLCSMLCMGQNQSDENIQSISDQMFFVQNETLFVIRECFILFTEEAEDLPDDKKVKFITNSILKLRSYYGTAQVASATKTKSEIKICEHRRMNLFALRLNQEIKNTESQMSLEERLADVIIEISQYDTADL